MEQPNSSVSVFMILHVVRTAVLISTWKSVNLPQPEHFSHHCLNNQILTGSIEAACLTCGGTQHDGDRQSKPFGRWANRQSILDPNMTTIATIANTKHGQQRNLSPQRWGASLATATTKEMGQRHRLDEGALARSNVQ